MVKDLRCRSGKEFALTAVRNPVSTIRNGVLALIWTLFIISFAVTFTLNFRPLYYFDISYLELHEATGLSDEVIRENYDVLIDYNNFWGPDTLEFPTFGMSESGEIHFQEVKAIFVTIEYMLIVTLVLGIAGSIWCRKRGERKYLKYCSILTVALPALVGLLIAVNWDNAFVLFHKIFFRNDYWLFSVSEDPVILILPDTFFLHCAVMILLLIVAGSLLCAFLYRRGKRKAATANSTIS